MRLLIAWLVVPVIFFELWPTKGYQYLLPVAPVVAVLAARLMVEWRPRRTWSAPAWVPRFVRQPRAIAMVLVVLSLAIPSSATLLGPAQSQVLAGGGGVPGGREAGQWIDANLPATARLMTIGPSMGNILQFYGHRPTQALSVSPDPLKRNPSYAPIRNADLGVRTGVFQYLVWDAFSAARTGYFSDKLMELIRRYDGRLVHLQTLPGAASGSSIGTPVIQIYEMRPASSAVKPSPPDPPSVAAQHQPVRREFIFLAYAAAFAIVLAMFAVAYVQDSRVRPR